MITIHSLMLRAAVAAAFVPLLGAAPLVPRATYALPATATGHFDHLAVDARHNRIFVAAPDAASVFVIDGTTGAILRSIRGFVRPHALLYRPDTDRLFVTDGGRASLDVFDGALYRRTARVRLQADADSLGYDPSMRQLYVVNGGGDAGSSTSTITAIDSSTNRVVANIPVRSKTLEAMALDTYRARLYVNDAADRRVVVLDRWQHTVLAAWPVPGAGRNVAMALDESRQRLFVGARNGDVVMFDTNTGKVVGKLAIPAGVDDMTYDVPSRRLYAAANGRITVYRRRYGDAYDTLGSVSVGGGAKTGRFDADANRYFAAVPASGAGHASVAALEPAGPGSVRVVHADPAREPVDAPRPEALVRAMLSEHQYLRKMGLHAVPPGSSAMAIIANGNATRIGFRTTAEDLALVAPGKTSVPYNRDAGFYNVRMFMFDAQHRRFGLLVMEIPGTSVADASKAARLAETLRAELAARIPSRAWLFGQ
jgi:DNA-binding beta-propeller fold protein YncE